MRRILTFALLVAAVLIATVPVSVLTAGKAEAATSAATGPGHHGR